MFNLVAHRGYPFAYPENSLLGIRRAVDHGATAVEFDVQCSREGTPYVFHDENTLRLTGEEHIIYELSDSEIQKLSAHAPDRFDNRFQPCPISTLKEVCEYLSKHPHVEVFIEPKAHSIDALGVEKIMDSILADSQCIDDQRVMISFHHIALDYARHRGCPRINWVIDDLNEAHLNIAKELKPDFLCVDIEHVDQALPKWIDAKWMVYPVNDKELLERYEQWGADYIETDCIGEM